MIIGVIAHGDSRLSGHGPGITILVSCSDGSIENDLDGSATLAALLKSGSGTP